MKTLELTDRGGRARTGAMQGKALSSGLKILAAVGLTSLALSGCITVEAPDEPIVIELNVNIRQEVIYQLADDAGKTIEENPGIF